MRQVSKQIFGVPSLQVARSIDDSDATHAASAAVFRYHARTRELEQAFEAKASELRKAFLAELLAIREREGE
jgi:hypothetical protein